MRGSATGSKTQMGVSGGRRESGGWRWRCGSAPGEAEGEALSILLSGSGYHQQVACKLKAAALFGTDPIGVEAGIDVVHDFAGLEIETKGAAVGDVVRRGPLSASHDLTAHEAFPGIDEESDGIFAKGEVACSGIVFTFIGDKAPCTVEAFE